MLSATCKFRKGGPRKHYILQYNLLLKATIAREKNGQECS